METLCVPSACCPVLSLRLSASSARASARFRRARYPLLRNGYAMGRRRVLYSSQRGGLAVSYTWTTWRPHFDISFDYPIWKASSQGVGREEGGVGAHRRRHVGMAGIGVAGRERGKLEVYAQDRCTHTGRKQRRHSGPPSRLSDIRRRCWWPIKPAYYHFVLTTTRSSPPRSTPCKIPTQSSPLRPLSTSPKTSRNHARRPCLPHSCGRRVPQG